MTILDDLEEVANWAAQGNQANSSIPAEKLLTLRNEFKAELLADTFEYCRESVAYYNASWSRAGVSPSGPEDLSSLPILYKREVQKNPVEFVSRAVSITGYRCTSGTTARRMPIPICAEENEALRRFGRARSYASSPKIEAPLVLKVMPPVRRLGGNSSSSGMGPVITTYLNFDAAAHRFSFDYVDHLMQCLTEPFPLANKEALVEILWTCPSFMVRTITDSLAHRNFDFEASSVTDIVCSGGIVTKALDKLVETAWKARLSAFYSLMEVVGSHARCSLTGDYHFDLLAYPEFLDPTTKTPVAPGEDGVLVLTSLYPFQQAQPMIRYWTGDIFTLKNSPCACGFVGPVATFRGRESECVNLGDARLPRTSLRFLGPADVLEALEAQPELPRFHKNPRFSIKRNHDLKRPIHLLVESYPMRSSRAKDLCSRIAEFLAERLRLTREGADDLSAISVELVPRGELDQAGDYYPNR